MLVNSENREFHYLIITKLHTKKIVKSFTIKFKKYGQAPLQKQTRSQELIRTANLKSLVSSVQSNPHTKISWKGIYRRKPGLTTDLRDSTSETNWKKKSQSKDCDESINKSSTPNFSLRLSRKKTCELMAQFVFPWTFSVIDSSEDMFPLLMNHLRLSPSPDNTPVWPINRFCSIPYNF